MYPTYTGAVLEFMYPSLNAPDDYAFNGSTYELDWYTTEYPKPTPAEVEAQARPWAAKQKRIEVKSWASAINGRAYEHAGNSDDFDDLMNHIRKAVREIVNDGLLKNGLDKLTVAESKDGWERQVTQMKFIRDGNEAKKLMRTEINALRDDPAATVEQILAYEVSDDKAATLHAAAYPSETPTLATLLATYPVQEV